MTLVLVTAPAAEPVSLADAKDWLRVTDTNSDTLITNLIASARQAVESETSRALITQTWEMRIDDFTPHRADRSRALYMHRPFPAMEIPKPPLQSVVSIKYIDVNGVLQTLASSVYAVAIPSGPFAQNGSYRLANDQSWPDTLTDADVVRVQFTAGYGAAPTSVPMALQHAILHLVADLYAYRERQIGGVSIAGNASAEALIGPFVVPAL